MNATQPYLLPIPTVELDLPLASSTLNGCDTYYNYRDIADDTSVNKTASRIRSSCWYMASIYGVTIDQLLTWNPSLTLDQCILSSGSRYYVIRHVDDTATCKPVTIILTTT